MSSNEIKKMIIPNSFSFTRGHVYDFDHFLNFFDWSICNKEVCFDLSSGSRASYQSISLLIPYMWYLYGRGCKISIVHNNNISDVSAMWRNIGGDSWYYVLNGDQFRTTNYKPFYAIRTSDDFTKGRSSFENYISKFRIEYKNSLRSIVSELLYNTIEHGVNQNIPSIFQFAWYKQKKELSFIIADLGIGIKNHLEQAYPAFSDDVSAILYSLQPEISGTFGIQSIYDLKNNAGMGLFISSSIIKKMHANMYIISGNGVVHISPTDITHKTIKNSWPGTFMVGTITIDKIDNFDFDEFLGKLKNDAQKEIIDRQQQAKIEEFYVSIYNYFGTLAEDKSAAIRFKNKYLINACESGKTIIVDFSKVEYSPHSFLNALLAEIVTKYGINSYKKIKITNAMPGIRETIDYIFDVNT